MLILDDDHRTHPNLWRFHLRGSNVSLVDDVITLVNAGIPRETDTIRAELPAAGITVPDANHALLTHDDLDHVGMLASLAPALEVIVR